MNRNLILPAVAVVAFTFMTWHLAKSHQPIPDLQPPIEPSRNPYTETIAGAGLVEPRSENIRVAAIVPGVVTAVHVRVGQVVEKGDILFQLDDRQRRAEWAVQSASVKESETALHRVKSAPRAEDIPPSEARVAKAKAELKSVQDQMDRTESLVTRKIKTDEDWVQIQQAFLAAQAALVQAEAEDARLKAGSWKEDIIVAEAQLARARALLQQVETELDRLQVRAPIRCTVLKVDVRPGEYVGTPPGQVLMMLGDVETMHVRVDIDEQDLPRFRPGLSGTGYVRGDASTPIDLRFVRVDPFAEPKKSLTNAGSERVDTRVLQVIYELVSPPSTLYVGQQIDVFLDAAETTKRETTAAK
ncbi:MAG TPA: HlyD family efflux transporter periplasmic adaptor subunit [Planctomycetaceae bacterium]|nr:HlyD family efflux transporter periplasmic adaptor subunit [Planctomycetaceae bacterium]